MNKKPLKITPIFRDLETKPWWNYQEFTEKELETVEDIYKKNIKEIQPMITADLFESIQKLYSLFGLHPHPFFRELPIYLIEKPPLQMIDLVTPRQEIDNPNQLSQQQMQQNQQAAAELEAERGANKFLILMNQKIDSITIKLLNIVWSAALNFTVLKFSHNEFSETEINQLTLLFLNPANKIVKLFFDWNPLNSNPVLEQAFYNKIMQMPTLEFLTMRSNQISDDLLQQLLTTLQANPNANLKYLDLYDNKITKKGADSIGKFIKNYNKLEYIGLAKNYIKQFDDIKEIIGNFGKFKLTEQELQEYKAKELERDTIIQKAQKAKKKVPDDLPKLDPLVQLQDGFAIIKNAQLKMLNLAMNQLGDNDSLAIEKLATQFNEDFQIVLVHNNFELKTKEKLRKKLKKNIFI